MNKDFMNPQKNGKICENHFSTMPPGKTSSLTVEERKWIILKFGVVKSPILVRRAFQKFVIRQ